MSLPSPGSSRINHKNKVGAPCRMVNTVYCLTRPTLARRDASVSMQGCSKREGEAYFVACVEPPTDVRTKPEAFPTILLRNVVEERGFDRE